MTGVNSVKLADETVLVLSSITRGVELFLEFLEFLRGGIKLFSF